MCPYSREAHVQLLYCYFCLNDWVSMERLLKKLLKHSAKMVHICNFTKLGLVVVIEDTLHPNTKRCLGDRRLLVQPSHCLIDEHARVITDDSEIVKILVFVLPPVRILYSLFIASEQCGYSQAFASRVS